MADFDGKPTPAERNAGEPSKLKREPLLRVIKQWMRDDGQHSSVWRTQAKEDRDFRAGRQWTAEEESQLKGAMRPVIVFNRAITMIKAVAGFEINGRHEIQFLPRNLSDAKVNEVLTGASKWMSDECDAEDEESEAFQDALTTGMGWTENILEFDEEPQGKYVEKQIDCLEMYWDYAARKKNVNDARRLHRLRKMPLSDAKAMFPGYEDDDYDARWAVGMVPEEETKTLEEKRRREENATDNFTERDEVHIVHTQWWEREPYHLVADPATNQKIELEPDKFKLLESRFKALGMPLHSVKMYRKRFKQAFTGAVILEVGDLSPQQFTWKCITGEADQNKGTWFGLMRLMRDPQKWCNKWLSQTLHIMNSNAKGGILAEPDAFEDQRKAEESYAKPEAITWMARGALSNASGPKWTLKPTAEFPAGFFQLLEFAVSSLRDVTGINLELLGQRDVEQAAVLEAQRKQAGMTVLATMFDSLRRFRKQVGSIRLYYIQNFLSDGRLIRITGPDGAQVIPLLKDKTLGEYSVHIDDAPTSPNQKEANWLIIQPFLPVFKEYLASNPELMGAILEFSPLPTKLVELVKTVMAQPNQQQQQTQQLTVAAATAKISKDQAQAELFLKQAQSTEATSMYDVAMAQNLLLKHQGDMVAALNEAKKSGFDMAKVQAETQHIQAKTQNENAKADQTQQQNALDALGAHTDALNAHTDAQQTSADANLKAAQAHHTRVKALVDALTPIPHSDPVTGGPQEPPPSLPVAGPPATGP